MSTGDFEPRWRDQITGRAPADLLRDEERAGYLFSRLPPPIALAPVPSPLQLSRSAVGFLRWRRFALASTAPLVAAAGLTLVPRLWPNDAPKRPSAPSSLQPPTSATETLALPPSLGVPAAPLARVVAPAPSAPARSRSVQPSARALPTGARTQHLGHPAATPPAARSDTAPLQPNLSPPVLSPLARETHEIAGVLEQLQLEHDPEGALASLVIYHLRFPNGALGPEARDLEIEANLAAGRRRAALGVLEQSSVLADGSPRAAEHRVLLGELLSENQRCPEALPWFERTLAQSGDAVLRARALLGRARCRARGGDPSGSRSDLERYLREYPSGEARSAVRRQLGAP